MSFLFFLNKCISIAAVLNLQHEMSSKSRKSPSEADQSAAPTEPRSIMEETEQGWLKKT